MQFFSNDIFFFNLISLYYYKCDLFNFSVWVVFPELFLFFILLIILSFIIFGYFLTFIYNTVCLLLMILLIFCLYINVFMSFNGLPDFKFLVHDFWLFDYYSFNFKILLIFLCIIILFFCKNIIYEIRNKIIHEFFVLFLFSLFFMFMLLSSSDFFFSYLSLEGMSFGLYGLACMIFYNKRSLESAIKYFILGGIASAILAYGISLLLIYTNSLVFFDVKFFLIAQQHKIWIGPINMIYILICFIIAFFFKLSAFPCHIWTPDVYDGIWTPVTAFFAIVVKCAVFAFFARIFCYIFSPMVDWWQFIIFFGALGSIIVGCFGALIQRKIKRFLAYTSINQVGFLLLGLGTCDIYGITSSFLFLFIYLSMNIIFFCLILNVKHLTENIQLVYLTDLYSLSSYNNYLGNLWVITLFSMAGVPPLAGFFSKLFILSNLINYSLYIVVLVVLIFSVISNYYYLNFIKYILFEKKKIVNLFFFNMTSFDLNIFILYIFSFFLIFFILIYFIFSKFLLKLTLSSFFFFAKLII